eukprot:1981272-Pleurochrysis_carterae.AAC.1
MERADEDENVARRHAGAHAAAHAVARGSSVRASHAWDDVRGWRRRSGRPRVARAWCLSSRTLSSCRAPATTRVPMTVLRRLSSASPTCADAWQVGAEARACAKRERGRRRARALQQICKR